MIDNNHVISKAVSMTIVPDENPNTFILNLTGDLGWLGDPNRAYPVTLDPTVSNQNWSTTIGTGLDTFVAEYAPNTQYYVNNYMTTGYDGVNNGRTRALVKFPMPTLPTGSIVTDGIMSLYKYTTTGATSEQLVARRITSSWSYSVTWNTQPTVDTTYTQTEASITNVAGSYTGWVNFNVWSIAKGWINGGLENDGIEIQHNTESNPLFFYYSSNDPSGLGPLLSITYITDQTGLNPYWSYANTNGGSVNTFNGNFLSSVTDFSLPGRGIPITVARTFNNRGSLNGLFGQKWFSNLDQQLILKSWGIVFLDSTGTERPFMLNSDNLTYTRPDNYPVQLYKDTSGGSTVYHIQEANSETSTYSTNLPTLTFDSSGNLTKIEDGKGNITTVTRTSSTVTVTDPSSRTATLSLNGDGTVNQITTSAETGKVKASYTYSNGYLTSATYDNGSYPSATVNYGWSGSNLISFTDKKGTKTYLNYDGNNRLISTGPLNALANPSFEASADGINPDNWTNSIQQDAGSIQLSTTAKYSVKSLDVHSVYQSGTSGTSRLWSKQQIPVQPNNPYVLSSFIKTVGLTGNAIAYLNIEEVDSNQNHLAWEDTSANPVTGTTDWTQKNLSITTTASTAYLNVYVEVSHDPNSFGGDAYFDGVQLQDGSTVTSFLGHSDFRYGTDGSFAACWLTKGAGELVEYKNNNYGTPAAIIEDPNGLKSETDMVWDAADHLRSLTTPEQVKLGASGKSYTYTYDALGNMLTATDPLGYTTSMNYYYNRLKTLTQPDNSTVTNVWNPANLNEDSNINQTMNSTAYVHDSAGNTTLQSNQLGLADNRIYNSGFEGPNTSASPTFSRNSTAYKTDWTQVAANTPRYENGKFGQGVTIEEGTTNLINTQGNGANTDWSKWTHWGNRSYWSSESQTTDPTYGKVYAGVNANSTATYLFDYYPYSVTSGASYTLSATLKASQAWTGNVTAYMIRSSDGATVGVVTLPVSLTTGWNQFSFPMSANQTLSSSVGIGLKFSSLPTGVTLSASRPQFEQLPYATSFTDSTRSGESLTLPTTVFTPTQGTIEAWVKPSRNPGQAIQMITDVAETGNNGLVLSLGTDGKFCIQAGTGSGVIQAKSVTSASQGTWYDVAGKWDGTGVSIYVNGVKEGTTTGSTNVILSSTPTIGRESQSALRWFDGLIDDVRISSIARTDTDIQNGYTSGQALAADVYTTYKLNFDNNLNVSAASFQPDNWVPNTPSGSVNQVEYDSTAPVGGSYVLHLNPGSNSYTYQWTDYIPVDANPYTLSSDIKTNGSSSTNGAALNIYWYNSSYTQLEVHTYFNLKSSAPWQRYISPNITPPTGAAYAKVMAINYGALDSYFDNIQFEQSNQARGYNYLDNSSFMRGNVRWNPSDSYSTVASDSNAFSDGHDGIVNLPSTGSSYLESQVVPVVNSGQSYSLAGFMSTQGVVVGTGGGARLHAVLLDTSGNPVSDTYSSLITGDTPWTKYAVSFKPTVTGKVKVRLEIYNASGIAKFDDVRLSSGNLITSTNYDNNKNYVISVKNQLNNTMTFENDSYGQVTKVTAPGGETVDYGYDGQEQLRSVKDNANNTTTYILDANGNVTDSSLLAGTSTYDHSSFSYDVHNNLLSETDANGNATGFKYDEGGRLQIKTNPDGSTVTLSYDALENVSQILFSDGKKYSYTYDLEGRRKTVKVYFNTTLLNEFTYDYDAVGNLTSYVEKDGNNTILSQLASPPTYSPKDELTGFTLTAGSNTISYSYSYTKNGLLNQVTGDGKSFSFIYDDGDNLINRTNPDKTKDSYTYNEAKQIVGSQTVELTIGTDIYAQALKWGG